MELLTIRLRDFRGYADASFSFSPAVNVIRGPNAAGKTNLLESVYFLAGARSWRVRRDAELIRFGCEQAIVEAECVSGGRRQTLRAEIFPRARRKLFCNGAPLRSPRELLGKLPNVLFAPEDLLLLKAGPALRRRFLDMALSQLSPRYVQNLSDYRRAHVAKTLILKRGDDALRAVLPDYDRQLARLSVALAQSRRAFLENIAERAKDYHRACAPGEELALRYVTQVTDGPNAEEELFSHIQRRRDAERRAAAALVGVHRDDIAAELNGRPLRDFASQGQTRTAAVAMKKAERDVLASELGEPPLLLLDDVLSELDENRQRFLLDHIQDGQVFLTACGKGELNVSASW